MAGSARSAALPISWPSPSSAGAAEPPVQLTAPGARRPVRTEGLVPNGPGSPPRRRLPRPGWGSVAVQHLGLVLVPGGGGAVRVQYQGPAPPVDRHLVMERAQQDTVRDRGLPAVGPVPGV